LGRIQGTTGTFTISRGILIGGQIDSGTGTFGVNAAVANANDATAHTLEVQPSSVPATIKGNFNLNNAFRTIWTGIGNNTALIGPNLYDLVIDANITGGGNALDSGFDREHRLALTFLMNFPWDIDVTGISTAQSGFWYNVVYTTTDPRGRQQEHSPWSYRTEMRLSKGFNLGGSRLGRIFVEGRNLFSQYNVLAWDNYNINSGRLWEEKQDPTGDLNRATTDVFYALTPNWSLGLSWWFEKWTVQDFTLDADANSDLVRGQALLLGYMYRPYTGNTTTIRVMYRW
jgi:hypothetical protein